MAISEQIIRASFTFFSTLLDIVSDFANSLEFMGYNIRNVTVNTLFEASKALIKSDKLTKDFKFEAEHYNHPETWGRIGIFIIFLPGIITLPPFLVVSIKKKKYLMAVLVSLFLLMYPITFIIVSFASLVQSVRGKDAFLPTTETMVGAEVFFEGFWQMVLQVFSLIYGYHVTSVQKFSIAASFILLAKASMEFDILMIKKKLTCKESMIHATKILPCYATTIIFRVISFSLTIAFLREWSAIPIGVLYIELVVISYWRYRGVKDKAHFFEAVYMLSLCNLAVLNTYNLGEQDFEENDKPDENRCRRFIKLSSIITLIHHCLVLSTIMALAWYHPGYLQQDQFQELIPIPDKTDFNYIFGSTIVIGLFSTVLSLHLANQILHVEVGDLEL